MLNIIFSCHVEPQRKSRDITYLVSFIEFLKKQNKKVILFLMIGDDYKDEIVNLVKKIGKTDRLIFGLHPHKIDLDKAITVYTKSWGEKPMLISFGHWDYTDDMLKVAAKNGVKKDFSYAAYKKNDKYFVKDPFNTCGLEESPVSCDPNIPINPLTSYYHFALALLLTIFTNKALHLTFHSYDLIEQGFSAKIRLYLLLNLPFIKYG